MSGNIFSGDIIYEKIMSVRAHIAKAASVYGRKPEEVKIIAVTKNFGTREVLAAVSAGIEDIGENKAQEFENKYAVLGGICRWHMIGHLQTNKVKQVVGKVALIHSADTIKLIAEIDRQSRKLGIVTEVLVQVNASGEETKTGINPEGVYEFLLKAGNYDSIRIKGLMTMAQYTVVSEETRPVFRKMNKIFVDIGKEKIDNVSMEILSMGMSNDYETAVEEGSNMVRIGTAIFGAR